MTYQAVIFDMDGTILDTLEDLKNATNYALRTNGYPERSLDQVRQFVGNGIRKLITRALPEGASQEEIAKTHETFTAYYKEHCADTTKPYDGIPALIQELRQAGVKTAVVSNKANYAVQELCKQYFDGLFDASMGEMEDKGIKKKPAPDMVNKILEELSVPREKAVYIGDSDVDLMTAKNSGLDCIAVKWGFRSEAFLKEHGATVLVDEPEKVKALILNS